jgi:hypothetical protein
MVFTPSSYSCHKHWQRRARPRRADERAKWLLWVGRRVGKNGGTAARGGRRPCGFRGATSRYAYPEPSQLARTIASVGSRSRAAHSDLSG